LWKWDTNQDSLLLATLRYSKNLSWAGQHAEKSQNSVFLGKRKYTRKLSGFLPKPLKRGQIKKIRALYTVIGGFYFYYLKLLFWFDLFLEARAEILEKIPLVFWEIWRHQKDILKLTDLYLGMGDASN
jgi:hypothetical protein